MRSLRGGVAAHPLSLPGSGEVIPLPSGQTSGHLSGPRYQLGPGRVQQGAGLAGVCQLFGGLWVQKERRREGGKEGDRQQTERLVSLGEMQHVRNVNIYSNIDLFSDNTQGVASH